MERSFEDISGNVGECREVGDIGDDKPLFLSQGADANLDWYWDIKTAQYFAFAANYSEQGLSCKAVPNPLKPFELLRADNHTLVSYFRKRIPCSCLDVKYKE